MKSAILLLSLALGFTAFADDVAQPSGEILSFDGSVDMGVCQIDEVGNDISCTGAKDIQQVKIDVSEELMRSGCRPACTYNDTAQFAQTAELKDQKTGKTKSFDLQVTVTRLQLASDKEPTFMIQISLDKANKPSDRSAITSVKSLEALNDLFVSGPSSIEKQKDGSAIKLSPSIFLRNFKITKK